MIGCEGAAVISIVCIMLSMGAAVGEGLLFTPVNFACCVLVVQVLVMADAAANPVHVAADLLSQAEHGPDSQVRDGSGTVGSIKECQEVRRTCCLDGSRGQTAM